MWYQNTGSMFFRFVSSQNACVIDRRTHNVHTELRLENWWACIGNFHGSYGSHGSNGNRWESHGNGICYATLWRLLQITTQIMSLWIFVSVRHWLFWHYMCIFVVLVNFCFFSSSTVSCTVEFTGHLLSDDMLLAIREWELERMGITNGNGKGMGLIKSFPLISDYDPKTTLA